MLIEYGGRRTENSFSTGLESGASTVGCGSRQMTSSQSGLMETRCGTPTSSQIARPSKTMLLGSSAARCLRHQLIRRSYSSLGRHTSCGGTQRDYLTLIGYRHSSAKLPKCDA